MKKEQVFQYNGNHLYGCSFNLYNYEGIDFEASKTAIEKAFIEKYQSTLVLKLIWAGCRFKGLKWYSPIYYNFEGDSLDLLVEIIDQKMLISVVGTLSVMIEKRLYDNKSYDGYTARTAQDVQQVVVDIERGEGLDIIALSVILDSETNFKGAQDCINNAIVFSAEEDNLEERYGKSGDDISP